MVRVKAIATGLKQMGLYAPRKDLEKPHTRAQKPQGVVKKKPHRWRPGTKALMEIRRYQRSVDLLLPKAPFERVVREIAQDLKHDVRFQRSAIEALQHACETLETEILAEAQLQAIAAKRITIQQKDIKMVAVRVLGQMARKAYSVQ